MEGQYLTYSEYQLLGGNLEQAPFDLLEFEARKQIDKRTFNRISNEIPEEVKRCVFAIINHIVSLNNGVEISGNAINYNPSNIEEISRNIIENFLNGVLIKDVPLLYRGI